MKTRAGILLYLALCFCSVGVRGQENPFEDYMLLEKVYESEPNYNSFIYTGTEGDVRTLVISDDLGYPVYMKQVPDSYANFQLQDSIHLSYYDADRKAFFILDRQYNEIDSVRMQNGYVADMHELFIDEDKNRWLQSYDSRVIDISGITPNRLANTTVTGLVLQEISEDGQLVFEWDAWDYFEVEDTYTDLSVSSINYVHCNSIQKDSDTSIVISSRNISEITKIDIRTGEIIWRLGGKNNQFEFRGDSKSGFSGQHSAWLDKNGVLSLYDNGAFDDTHYSRGIRYLLDTESMSATLVSEYRHELSFQALIMGNVQVMEEGKYSIFWGATKGSKTGAISNYMGDDLIFDAFLKNSVFSYRVYQGLWKPDIFSLSHDSLCFVESEDGYIARKQIEITNNSNESLVINAVSSSDHHFRCAVNSLPLSLALHESASIEVLFCPDTIGLYKEQLYFAHLSDTLVHSIRVPVSGVSSTIEVGEDFFSNKFEVFPNPFVNVLFLRMHSSSIPEYYSIRDMLGRIVAKGECQDQIDGLEYLKQGMYILELRHEDGVAQKIVIKK